MLAPNLVYATVEGYYPRLLADNGVHEPLVLPYDLVSNVPFEFYRERDANRLNGAAIIEALCVHPNGSRTFLAILDDKTVQFAAEIETAAIVVLTVALGNLRCQCYPFRVLRPTETYTAP